MVSESFKVAVLSPEVPDGHVKKLFLDLTVESEADIEVIVGILAKHRPAIVEETIAVYALKKALCATTTELLEKKTENAQSTK